MRLVAYVPALQREQSVTATLDQHRAAATPPENFNELDLAGLGAALTPCRIAAAQEAYKALHRMGNSTGAPELAAGALRIIAAKSALLACDAKNIGAADYASQKLGPHGLALTDLPRSIQESLAQVESEFAAA